MKDDTISRQAAIDALIAEFRGKTETYWDTSLNMYDIESVMKGLPSAQPDCYDADYTGGYVKEEDILKFYYVESIDDYWVGRRLDNFYYATWDTELQNFVWSKSRYLPWGEHVVAPDTLWKEHTYPSEPKEIPFADWLKGFCAKYWDGHTEADAETRLMSLEPERKRGWWIDTGSGQECSECGEIQYGYDNGRHFCANCGADMRGDSDEA